MKNTLIFSLLVAILSGGGCSKSEVPDGGGTSEFPVFSLAFQFGDQGREFEAGRGGYYLFTDVNFVDSVGTLVFKGAFADAACPTADCPGSFGIELGNFLDGDTFDFNSSVWATEYPLAGPRDSLFLGYSTLFGAKGGGTDPQYSWEILPGFPQTGESAMIFFDTLPQTPAVLRAVDAFGFVSTYSKKIQEDNACTEYVVSISNNGPNGFSLAAKPTMTMPGTNFQYTWSNGSQEQRISVDSAAAFTVTASDGQGCTAVISVENYGGNPDFNVLTSALFHYNVWPYIRAGDADRKGKAAVQWIDDQGFVWRSDRKFQNGTLKISSREPYDLVNEKGLRALKLTLSFEGLLFREDGFERTFSGSGVIGVARPD